jgi:hypothetical protein
MGDVVKIPDRRERYWNEVRKCEAALVARWIPKEGREWILDDWIRRLDQVAFRFERDTVADEQAIATFHQAVGAIYNVKLEVEVKLVVRAAKHQIA